VHHFAKAGMYPRAGATSQDGRHLARSEKKDDKAVTACALYAQENAHREWTAR
jgi:hypothetical protein